MNTSEQFQMTKPAPMIWASVIDPRPARKLKTGEPIEPTYEATWLFPPDHQDLPPLRALLAKLIANFDHETIKEKIRANKDAGREPYSGLKFPLENGDKIADRGKAQGKDREFTRGMAVFQAKVSVMVNAGPNKGKLLQPPNLVVLQNGAYVRYRDEERPLAKKFFYSGVLAVGIFGLMPYSGMGGGIAAYLNEILSLNVGEKINTGVDDEARYGPADAYKGYVGHVSATDPTAGAEQIPW